MNLLSDHFFTISSSPARSMGQTIRWPPPLFFLFLRPLSREPCWEQPLGLLLQNHDSKWRSRGHTTHTNHHLLFSCRMRYDHFVCPLSTLYVMVPLDHKGTTNAHNSGKTNVCNGGGDNWSWQLLAVWSLIYEGNVGREWPGKHRSTCISLWKWREHTDLCKEQGYKNACWLLIVLGKYWIIRM